MAVTAVTREKKQIDCRHLFGKSEEMDSETTASATLGDEQSPGVTPSVAKRTTGSIVRRSLETARESFV